MRNCLTELTGSFFLALALGLSGHYLAAGAILALITYLGMSKSTAQFNPAISLGFWAAGRLSGRQCSLNMTVQIAGFLLAGALLAWISGSTRHLSPGFPDSDLLHALVDMTMALLFAGIYLGLTSSSEVTRFQYSLLVGLAYGAVLLIAEPVTGSYLNPAGVISFLLMEAVIFQEMGQYLSLYILAPLIGALLAGYLARWLKVMPRTDQEAE